MSSGHRILKDLLDAFNPEGPGYSPLTATATGTKIADDSLLQIVVPTWGAATNILILPAPTPGLVVIIAGAATGGELRSSAPATVAINGGTGVGAESAVAAGMMVVAICESATSWKAFTMATNGDLTKLEAAA